MPDGSCACEAGYELEASNRKFCIPKCSQGCSNGAIVLFFLFYLTKFKWKILTIGNCTAPDTCECNVGYKLNENTKKCQPICLGGCGFGECVAPEQCSCLPGYQKTGKICTPICARFEQAFF